MSKKVQEDPNFCTREEAAIRLGFSTGELRRRERLGQIRFAKRGSHGACLYRVEDVQALDELLAGQKGNYTIEEAKRVFELLRAGKTLVDCVIEGDVRPDSVEALADRFATLNKGVFVSAETLAKINDMAVDGPLPIKSETEMLEFFVALEAAKCLECATKPRAFCQSCVKSALKRAKGDDDLDG